MGHSYDPCTFMARLPLGTRILEMARILLNHSLDTSQGGTLSIQRLKDLKIYMSCLLSPGICPSACISVSAGVPFLEFPFGLRACLGAIFRKYYLQVGKLTYSKYDDVHKIPLDTDAGGSTIISV